MGYGVEVEMIRLAHRKGLLTTPYVFSDADAVSMTEAGADIIVAHMGLTTGGRIGAQTAVTLEACVAAVDSMAEAAMRVRSDIIVLCHGGPIATPDDAAFVLRGCRTCHGFYGASSMERLPSELAVTEAARAFKTLTLGAPGDRTPAAFAE
jgi:predicted TIM-barrel enzyme